MRAKSFQLILTTKAEVAGLTSDYLQFAAQKHRNELNSDAKAETGPWLVGLDQPSFLPFMQYSERSDLRAKLYRAMITSCQLCSLRQHRQHSHNLATAP